MQKNLSNKELVAAGHQFAKNLSSDTLLIDMAKMVSQLATQLDVTLVAAGEACKQRDAVLAENVVKGDVIERLIGQYSCAGYHAVQNSLNPAQSLLYDAMQAQKAPATEAILNAVRAEAIRDFWNASLADVGHVLEEIGAYQDASEAAGIVHDELKERVEDFASQLRDETDTTPSQYESLAGGK